MIVKQPDQKFPTAPEGTFPAVCVDEIDLGKVKSTYGGEERERNMVRLVWQIDEEMDNATAAKYSMPPGSRHIVKQDYTASLDEKAKLRKHLQSWRGRVFTLEELAGFDLENVVGIPCLISIAHATGKKGGRFANVEGVMKPPKGMDALHPLGYVRVKDRKAAPVPIAEPKAIEEEPPEYGYGISDSDVPF
jgi:hypothetical protein